MNNSLRMIPIYSLLFFLMRTTTTTTTSLDSITPGQSIRYEYDERLVSASATFELGFFRPRTSKTLYVGIWYKNSPSTVVWVANREAPLNDTSGVLQLNDQGILVLINGTKSTVWSSKISGKPENPIAQLLDSGNLVVRNEHDNNMGNLLWQSFDYPSDTLLPGMKIGRNLETGLERVVSCWKSADDPGLGDYKVRIDLQGYPQAIQLKGNVIQARGGPWNGLYFTGYAGQKPNSVFKEDFVINEKEVYLQFENLNRSIFPRYVLSPSGMMQWSVWRSQTSSWEQILVSLIDQFLHVVIINATSQWQEECFIGSNIKID